MASFRLLTLMVLAAIVTLARGAKTSRELGLEVLWKTSHSAIFRFKAQKIVKEYFVSVTLKFMADIPSDYYANVKQDETRKDGYIYIDTKDTLQPGQLYEIWVAAKPKWNTLGYTDFTTDCDEYSYQCKTGWGQGCLSPEDLCNGDVDCLDGSDEETNEDGSCANSLPVRPPPPTLPPPPADSLCMLALTAAKARNDAELPECGSDGNYAPMRCGGESEFSCHCLHPITGEILHTQPDFNPFVHWDYHEKCEERRTAAVGKDKKI